MKKKYEYKVCQKCGEDKPKGEYPRSTSYGAGLICNICVWDTKKMLGIITYKKVAAMLMAGNTNSEIKKAIPVTKEGLLECKVICRRYMRENNMLITF